MNLVGQRFSGLVVTAKSDRRGRNTYWDCICDCGTATTVSTHHLTSCHTRSCGCLQRRATSAAKTKHGMTGTGTHKTWAEMHARCTNPRSKIFKFYGGRGIKVCGRWQDFATFLADMGERPPGMSLDRVDSNGNYEPSNCRWADRLTQANNTRSNRFIEHEGRSQTVAQWARELGVPARLVYGRLGSGWPPSRALLEPPHYRGR